MPSELIPVRALREDNRRSSGLYTEKQTVINAFLHRIRHVYATHAKYIYACSAIFAVLLFWQLGSGVLMNDYYLSRPTEIVRQIIQWIANGYLFKHLVVTLINTAAGFMLAAISGIALAALFASVPVIDRVFSPYIYALFSLPKIVLAPLLILWFGVGALSVIFMSFITGFFMVFFNVYSGMRNVSPALINVARIMGAGLWTTAIKVRLPAARAFVALGMHQGLVYAFHGAIVGEMVSSPEGLGYALVYAASDMDANGVLAILMVLACITLFFLHMLGKVVRHYQGGAL